MLEGRDQGVEVFDALSGGRGGAVSTGGGRIVMVPPAPGMTVPP